MELLVEVKIENGLPMNDTWNVPELEAMTLIPVTNLFRTPDLKFEWTEDNVFRAYKNDEGEIKLQFPMNDVEDFNLLAFSVARVIDGMVSAILDTEWGVEYVRRASKKSGILKPQTQVRGPLKL